MELLLLEWLSRLLYPNTGLVTKASYQIILKKKKRLSVNNDHLSMAVLWKNMWRNKWKLFTHCSLINLHLPKTDKQYFKFASYRSKLKTSEFIVQPPNHWTVMHGSGAHTWPGGNFSFCSFGLGIGIVFRLG